MASIAAGLIAFVAGLGLAAATAFGVVSSQSDSSPAPVSVSNVSYGSNN
ncbi:MAG: hypothetical protein JWP10_2003 [Nocardioidaceae bacterium]|nr:hypothetical protein [Nocardioidaceae bacterium]